MSTQTETFFVGDLPFRADERFVRELFAPFGDVHDVRLVADWVNPTCEPHAFVEAAVSSVDDVVVALDGKRFGRFYLRVNKYVPIPGR